MLKRKPSGLRRRTARKDFPCSNKSDKLSSKLDRESESSDSPYVSTTSSDCLTTATDDNSSITSSLYYGTSSLPSSPSVSNRNSACFSDTSTSDASDIRRIVQQSPPFAEFVHGELYARPYNIPSSRGLTLDQRFGFIEKNRVSPNEGLQNLSSMRPGLSLINQNDFQEDASKDIKRRTSNFPRTWQRDQRVSPLLVRSDSDLNRLTKVQFVGDSYSRSRISKNVRYTRNRSQSPSLVVPTSPHTRVVSCEIVTSDDRKRDVYTKVMLMYSFRKVIVSPFLNYFCI